MISCRNIVIAVSTFSVAFALWASPTLADPLPTNVDWKEFMDLIEEDPDTIVGEEMC